MYDNDYHTFSDFAQIYRIYKVYPSKEYVNNSKIEINILLV